MMKDNNAALISMLNLYNANIVIYLIIFSCIYLAFIVVFNLYFKNKIGALFFKLSVLVLLFLNLYLFRPYDPPMRKGVEKISKLACHSHVPETVKFLRNDCDLFRIFSYNPNEGFLESELLLGQKNFFEGYLLIDVSDNFFDTWRLFLLGHKPCTFVDPRR